MSEYCSFSHEVMIASLFTNLFIVFLAASTAFGLWLTMRHMRHVADKRSAVPAEFTDVITLEAHQKAADYTLDKQRIGLIESAVDVLVLLALTLGGGLSMLYVTASSLPVGAGNASVVGLMFILLLSVVTGLIGLPFDLVRTFRIEAKYGFKLRRASIFWIP
jgi:STE24 endopeptidase